MNKDLIFRLKAKTEGEAALSSFDRRLRAIETSSQKMSKGLATAGNFLKTFIGFAAIKQGIDFGKGIIDIADALGELQQKTGISANALSGYQEAAKQAGLSQEGLATSLRKYSQAIAQAKAGSTGMSAAFRNLGVSSDDLRSKTPEQLMAKLSDNFVKMKDSPEKAANALKIFGRAGTDMIPFLNQGSEKLKEFELGFSGDFVRRADEFNDAISALGSSFNKGFGKGLAAILPTLQDVLNTFKKFPSMGTDVQIIAESIGEAFRLAALAASNLTTVTVSFIDTLVTFGRQAKLVVTGNFAEAERLERARSSRQSTRDQAAAQRQAALLRNSRLFGSDQIEMIRLREQIATAPDSPKRKGGTSVAVESAEVNKLEAYIKLKKEENAQMKEALNDYRLSSLELLKVKSARELDKEAIKASKGMTQQQTAALLEQTEAIKEQRKELIELEYEQSRTFGYGATKYFKEYMESATDAAKHAERVFGTAFKGMEDGLLEFCKTGVFNFQKFADAIIEEIMRIIIRQQVIAPIAGAIGGAFAGGGVDANSAGGAYGSPGVSFAANGGVMTAKGMTKLNTYARGGIANSPQLAVFGEGSRPEAYVPLPDGRNIPVKMDGGAGGCNVNVVVNMSDGSSDSKSSSEQGKMLGTVIANAVKSELIKQKRPGGLIAG